MNELTKIWIESHSIETPWDGIPDLIAQDIKAHISAQDAIIAVSNKENAELREALDQATYAYAEIAKQLREKIAKLESQVSSGRTTQEEEIGHA